jgi:hypothetical protein
MAKMTMKKFEGSKADMKMDKKMGYKEGSPKDMAMDKKMMKKAGKNK